MSHATLVLQVDPQGAVQLRDRLNDGLPGAEWRTVPHARFQVRAEGVVLTCYRSGKVVLQGRDLAGFVARFLDGADAVPAKSVDNDPDLPFDAPTIGSDEAGKGDYFGPLVVAAACVGPDDTAVLRELQVTDSKAISDRRAHVTAAAIEARFDTEIVRLAPADYNQRWAAVRNVNIVLAELHAVALVPLLQRNPQATTVVVDRFAAESLVADAVRARGGKPGRLIQVPRAERHLAVAAASIVARSAFLTELAACSEACGTDLHKGAGTPVDVVARRVYAIGGDALLGTVAKLHFKNTSRARA